MKPLLRFSISGIFGIIITAVLFVGMLSLLRINKTPVSNQDTNINFSFVKDFDEPAVKDPIKREKPELQQSSQAPNLPPLPIDNFATKNIEMPGIENNGKQLNILEGVKMPGPGGGGIGSGDSEGMIKTAIAPMYPQKPLSTKTEGWVKVLITVNELGTVSDVSVLQAKPSRVFNSAALKAVRKWKFHPKKESGKAIPFQVTQTIEFKLDQ